MDLGSSLLKDIQTLIMLLDVKLSRAAKVVMLCLSQAGQRYHPAKQTYGTLKCS